MSLNNKKKFKDISKPKSEKKREKGFWMSIFILVIMILSIGGFALMSGGGQSTSSNGAPSEVPFQEFRDPNTGQVFWGAIRNSEQFIFLSLEGFEEDEDVKGLASRLKILDYVNLYIDSNFTSQESIFLINKALLGLKIPVNNVYDYSCSQNTLILTHKESSVIGECLIFEVSEDITYNKTEALVYHMVKE